MAVMKKVRVLRTVKVSEDGIHAREIIADTDDEIAADLFDGLVAEGYVAEAGAPALGKMSVSQLIDLAAERGIDLGDATKKADIIAAIELAQESAA